MNYFSIPTHRLLLLVTLIIVVVPGSFAWVAPTLALGCRQNQQRSAFSPLTPRFLMVDEELFEDEEDEMFPIAEHYVHAKYQAVSEIHNHEFCTVDDAREILRGILPPVTQEELDAEVAQTVELILKNPANTEQKIDEDDFVKAIVQNRFWKQAGSLVVKELMYFDALHTYYRTGSPLLNNDDYETLKENLTWEGSSVATMNAQEALFVTAVASARRGDPILEDEEYASVKQELKQQGSWVTNRSQDALEKLGLNTFMGYLHRAL